MTRGAMQLAIDKLYAILSKRATENVLLHRVVERQRLQLRRLRANRYRAQP